MSTPPQSPENTEPSEAPDTGSASSPAKRADGPKVLFATVYPILGGIALRYIAAYAAISTLPDGEVAFAESMALISLLLISGVHLWCKRTLEEYEGEHRTWQFPTVLSTAMAAGIYVSAYALSTGTRFLIHPAVVCTAFCLLGAFVFSLVTERKRFGAALGAIFAVFLLLAGMVWLFYELRMAVSKDELLQEADAVEHPIAVLDDLDWEPAEVRVDLENGRVSIAYEHAEYSRATDGFQLWLETESMQDLNDSSLYDQCESGPDENGCEAHGDVVFADRFGWREEAATEFTDGYDAELSTDMPADEGGDAQAEAPDFDMVELAGQIRAAEPGEAEEIVDDAY